MSTVMAEKSILVVEDSADIRLLLIQLLKMAGYKVTSAVDGKDALEMLQSASELPDLILLDLMMPNMDGFEFREKQQDDTRLSKIPVMIMTADSDVESKAAKLGVKSYLRKPFLSVDVLLDLIRQTIL